jgi:glycosyltransferase involved in cell wall biosynthesis
VPQHLMANLPQPLLTIAIPTWNRAEYLRLNLEQLRMELAQATHAVELLISDNCSEDETAAVAADFIAKGLPIRHIRNSENIGSDHNIAQCFNEAAGKYVLILGDDDLLIDGALNRVLEVLAGAEYGVVFLRPYGYEQDFRAERPAGRPHHREFSHSGKFIASIGALAGLISCNIINKQILAGEDARKYCGTNLVQTYLIFDAALRSKQNIMLEEYLVAYKRNNWGFYPFSLVFVERFWAIVDYFAVRGLDETSMRQLARNMLIGYYPFYVWRQRLRPTEGLQQDYLRFRARFRKNIWFWLMIAPQFILPRPLAIVWGGGAVIIGRSMRGDAWRGVNFIWSGLSRKLSVAKKNK